MLEAFSASYYVGRLYVEPHEGRHAVMERGQHEAANERVYAAGEGVERLDHLLVMKISECHVPVFAADDVPSDTLGLPEPALEAATVERPPTLTEVLVAKAERAAQLLRWTTPYSIQEPDQA